MKKVTIAICIASIFISGIIYAQEAPSIIPPNPEAASIAKFIETPVSYFTGMPSIQVPIYNINSSGISIPVGLSYHSRGIKVDEIAPTVGIGWAFSNGGSISRQIRGSFDFDAWGYLNTGNGLSNYYEDIFTDEQIRQTIRQYSVNHDGFDFVPDQFFFDFNGTSGKFFIEQQDHDVVIQKYDDIKIEYFSNEIPGQGLDIQNFIVTDKLGNKYYFGKSKNGLRTAINYDYVLMNHLYIGASGDVVFTSPNNWNYSSWMLMDIETANGVMISYEYEENISNYYRKNYDKSDTYNNGVQNFENTALCSFDHVQSHQYLLKNIIFDDGKLSVNYSNEAREDLLGGKKIDNIKIYDKHNVEVDNFHFDYYYSIAPDNGNQLSYLKQADPYSSKRLFLKSITQIHDNIPQSYDFEYNDSLSLPNRFSTSADIWGFYNGKNNGAFLAFFNESVSDSNDRTVDPIYSGVGILNKITYPTGGYTNFVYDDNFAPPSNELKSVFSHKINPSYYHEIGLGHLEYSTNFSNNVYSKTFQVGKNVNHINVNIWFGNEEGCSDEVYVPGCNFQVSIEHNGTVGQLFMGSSIISYSNLNNDDLNQGEYTIRVYPNIPHNPLNPEESFNVSLYWYEQEIDEDELIYAGGKRIKKIENYEAQNVLSFSKEFSYVDEENSSTGVLFGLPEFMPYQRYFQNELSLPILSNPKYCSVTGGPLSTGQGNSVGYSKVTEYYGEKQSNVGKIVYEFSTIKDSGDYYEFPMHIPTDNEWLRGNNLLTRYYAKNADSTYILKKTVSNHYLYADDLLYTKLRPSTVDKHISENITDPNQLRVKTNSFYRIPFIIYTGDFNYFPEDPEFYRYKTYYVTGGTLDLHSSTETEFLDNGEVVAHTTVYDYDYNNHYQLYKNTFSNSYSLSNGAEDLYIDNEPIETKYYYANSPLLNGLSGITELKNKHMIGIPLKVQSYKAGTKISEVYTEYYTLGQKCLPHYVYTAKGDLPLERKITYNSYDEKGNLLQYTMENGNPVYFVWGYNNSKPIIKIEGVNDGVFPSFTNAINLSNNGTEENLIDELNYIRTQLPNAMVTTLTYKPLIGVSSVTDPKGDTQYYKYDAFNRLEFVKDKTGKILSKNEYHYRPTE
jgi:hypothetical protein